MNVGGFIIKHGAFNMVDIDPFPQIFNIKVMGLPINNNIVDILGYFMIAILVPYWVMAILYKHYILPKMIRSIYWMSLFWMEHWTKSVIGISTNSFRHRDGPKTVSCKVS